MRGNSASKNGSVAGWISRYWAVPGIIVPLILAMVACTRFSPPGPNVLGGSIDQTSYLLLDWPEGLQILIWDDVFEGGHDNHTESATNDPMFHQSGSAESVDGRTYEYSLETRDGLQADFTIDDRPYDLDQGKLFLIRTAGGVTQVEQLDLDLSGLSPTNAGIEDFGRKTVEIADFIQTATNVVTNDNCPRGYGESESPTETMLPTNPLPSSLKGYVIQSYCWDGQWYFTLDVGLNAMKPCDRPGPYNSDNSSNYTVKGVEGLLILLDQLPSGAYVTWCSFEQTVEQHRMPDPEMTTAAATPDNSLWYAFDVFDDIGGSLPGSQNYGLYNLWCGWITG